MKKVFKFFALALVAGSMMTFVACGDDPVTPDDPIDTTTPTPDPGTDPQTPDTPEGTIAVTFGDDAAWNAAYVSAYDYQGFFFSMISASEPDGDGYLQFPCFSTLVGDLEVGTYTDNFSEDDMAYVNGYGYTVDYYEAAALSNGQGGSYGDWWAESFTFTVESYDATSLVLKANITANMFSALEAFVQNYGACGMDAASKKALTCGVNYALTPYGKSMPIAKKSNKLFVK